MKKTCSLTITAVVVALNAVFSFTSPAIAQVIPQASLFIVDLNSGEATNLGFFGGVNSFGAGDINNKGQIVGTYYSNPSNPTPHIFITGPNGMGRTELGSGAGYGINDLGQVAASHSENGLFEGLAINNAGQVAGAVGNRASITSPNDEVTDLGTLGGGRL